MQRENKRFESLLSRVFPDSRITIQGGGQGGSVHAVASGRFGEVRLRLVWIGTGWPADVHRALVELGDPELWPSDLVLVAQQMSPGAIALLETRSASWADETGSARIVAPGAVVERRGAPPDKPVPPHSWSPSAIAVAEGLLAKEWPDGVRTTELANLVQWSPGRVSNILQRFDEEGWTAKYGAQRGSNAARELVEPASLLDAWAAAAGGQDREVRTAHRAMRSPLDFLEGELARELDAEVRWSLSGWAAARVLAPITDSVPSLQIYVHEDDFGQLLDLAIAEAGLSVVAEGGRITFIRAHPSVLALSESTAAGPVASAPRVYADLLAEGGRGEDLALHLREESLDWARPRAGGRRAPAGLLSWEQGCRDRLDQLAADRPSLARAYGRGTWSATYRLAGVSDTPSAARLLAILREVVGRETGWPAWRIPERQSDGPHPVDGMIECWMADTVFGDAAHADYWRADPGGRMCLIRGYQEDSAGELRMAATPGDYLDLTLPIWRTGECLLHAGRLARHLDATAVQLMMRWTGLRGRSLAVLSSPSRFMDPTAPASQDEVVSFVELTPNAIDANPARAVRELVAPLYASFDFFEPVETIYDEELASMRQALG